tara:strand:+ start:864 stop:2879 length:2016 start_codon:yes stop_codon:yes gene_type:complete
MEYNTQLDEDNQFTCYLDYKKKNKSQKNLNFLNKIVISMEGLHYLHSYTPDLLIVDEINANLISHVSIETNGKNIDNNIFHFNRMLNFSKKVIIADAFLGSKVCDFFTDLKIPLHIYNYQRKLDKKKAIFLEPVSKEVKKEIKKDNQKKGKTKKKSAEDIFKLSQTNKLIPKLLRQGKKVYSFFSTRAKLELVEKQLQDDYKCLFYSGVSQNEIPKDLNDVWSKQDLIATTSTISVGVNHSKKNVFNTKIIHFQSSSKNNISDAIQSHLRVRNIIDDCIYVEVDEDSLRNNVPIIMDDLVERMNHKVNWYTKMDKVFSNVPLYINNLIKNNYIENQLSQVASKKMMIRYLKDCNYDIIFDNDEKLDLEIDDDDQLEDDIIDDDENVNILKEFSNGLPNAVRFYDLEQMKLKRKLTEKELEEMSKYWFITMYTGGTVKGLLESNLPTIALAYRLWKAKFSGNKTLRIMRLEKQVLNGFTTIEELVEKRFDKTQFAELQSNDIIKVKRILEVCKALGLKHSNDTETIITQDSINSFYEEAKESYDDIRKDMQLQDKRKEKDVITEKQFTGIIKGCFTNSDSSLCTMKVHQSISKRVKGKVVRQNTYKLYPNDSINQEMKLNNLDVLQENNKGGNYKEIEYNNVSIDLYNNLDIRIRDEFDNLAPNKRLMFPKK